MGGGALACATSVLTAALEQELKRLRKAGKHGELLTKAKQLWYTIRTKTSSSADRKEAVASLLVLLKGKVRCGFCADSRTDSHLPPGLQMLDVVLRHDASRIVQVIIQFGNEEQQGKVLQVRPSCPVCSPRAAETQHNTLPSQELKGHWVNFCKSRHGHFVVCSGANARLRRFSFSIAFLLAGSQSVQVLHGGSAPRDREGAGREHCAVGDTKLWSGTPRLWLFGRAVRFSVRLCFSCLLTRECPPSLSSKKRCVVTILCPRQLPGGFNRSCMPPSSKHSR